jgi:hypothetical protein
MLQLVDAAYPLPMRRNMHPRLLTLEEYEALPEDDYYVDEVSRGRLVREPRPASVHGLIVARLAHELPRGPLFATYNSLFLGPGRQSACALFQLSTE